MFAYLAVTWGNVINKNASKLELQIHWFRVKLFLLITKMANDEPLNERQVNLGCKKICWNKQHCEFVYSNTNPLNKRGGKLGDDQKESLILNLGCKIMNWNSLYKQQWFPKWGAGLWGGGQWFTTLEFGSVNHFMTLIIVKWFTDSETDLQNMGQVNYYHGQKLFTDLNSKSKKRVGKIGFNSLPSYLANHCLSQ